MKKVSIIGYYENETTVSGGQGIKTAILTSEIERACGSSNVAKVSTYEWRKNPILLVSKCLKAVFTSKNILYVTDENGVRVFPKLFNTLNAFHRYKTHYYVVGGWLTEYLEKEPSAKIELKKVDSIYVEIPSMYDSLIKKGFKNVILVNKFRRIVPAKSSELPQYKDAPYRLCFFARVMKEKGIEDAISAIKYANEKSGFCKYKLDIFGAIDPNYKDKFETILKALPEGIEYKGIVDFKKSTEVLTQYFAMIFPTFYKSEGYPNTVVDSFAAGLPIIASDWKYNAEIIRNGEDGLIVPVGDIEKIIDAMESLANNNKLYHSMRINCLNRCEEYLPQKAIEKVISNLK